MGNCLVIQDRREIKVMSVVDGEVLKPLPAPPPSKGTLARVSGSSDADDALRPQKQSLDVRAGGMGQLHRLFPSDAKAPSAAAEADPEGAVVRVKLVISKQELRRMLGKDDEAVSMDDMVALLRGGPEDQKQEDVGCYRGWRPALHSIPEGSGDLYSILA